MSKPIKMSREVTLISIEVHRIFPDAVWTIVEPHIEAPVPEDNVPPFIVRVHGENDIEVPWEIALHPAMIREAIDAQRKLGFTDRT